MICINLAIQQNIYLFVIMNTWGEFSMAVVVHSAVKNQDILLQIY